MAPVLAWVMKNILTEKVLKSLLGLIGDMLVKSSKNKLDDKIWASVKKKLNV